MRGAGRIGKRHLIRTGAAVAGALGMLLVVVAPAEASWTPVQRVSHSTLEGQDQPSVAVDRQGDSVLAWVVCTPSTYGCIWQAQARIKPRHGRMGPIRTLSPLKGYGASWPKVAADDNGDSAVVWTEGASAVGGRRISATGRLGRLRTLSAPGVNALNPTVAVTPKGRALAVWVEENNGAWHVVGRFFGKNSSLGRIMTFGSGTADMPAVAIDRSGTAVVVWAEGNTRLVAKRVRPGHVSRLHVIMSGSNSWYGMPSLGEDRSGNLMICFSGTSHAGTGLTQLWARRWSRRGRLGRVLHVSRGKTSVTAYHSVATDRAGGSMAVWSQYTTTPGRIKVFGRRISRTGSLGPITRLGPGTWPHVTLDDRGKGLVVWQSLGASSSQVTKIYAREISPSGAFGRRLVLSPDGGTVDAASSPWGGFSVIWQRSTAPWPIRARFGS